MSILEIKNASRAYGNVQALDNVSLSVPEGVIYGLLGPNGAGKTTLVKSVTDLIRLDSGEILIDGIPHHLAESRENLAFLPESFRFYPYYSVTSALNFFCDLSRIPGKGRTPIIERALQIAKIENLAGRKISTLSKGQTQRVGIAALFLASPKLIILDEPFSGLDPISIKEFKDALRHVREEGRTVLVNSHILSEVETLCDRIGILHEGHVLAEGTISELKKESTLEDFFYTTITGSHEEAQS